MILFSVKQSIRTHTRAGDFVERLQEALAASATEQGRNLADLKLSFLVVQHAGCFIGSSLQPPSARNLEVFGKMRSVLEPFRQYAQRMGSKSTYWRYGPVHLEDAWKRLQSAVAEAWRLAGLTIEPFCGRSVPFTRSMPRSATQACNVGSGFTWQRKTRMQIARGACEKRIRIPLAAGNGGSEGRWQCKTETDIGRRDCEKGTIFAYSFGSGGRWHWKTRTSIGRGIYEKGGTPA